MPRFEMRVSQEWLDVVDGARGFESRGSFVKRTLERVLSDAQGATSNERAGPAPVASPEAVRPAASTRAPVEDEPEGTPLPKIAARKP